MVTSNSFLNHEVKDYELITKKNLLGVNFIWNKNHKTLIRSL